MKLHKDRQLFGEILARAAEHPVNGGLGIARQFIEKDYRITNVLFNLWQSGHNNSVILEGGICLSKAYGIGFRLSDTIHVDVMSNSGTSKTKLRNTVGSIDKVMSAHLQPLCFAETNKELPCRKAFYAYGSEQAATGETDAKSGQILLDINTVQHPSLYGLRTIGSFVYDYLISHGLKDIISEFSLEPFRLNAMDKRCEMVKRLARIMWLSFSDNPVGELESGIRYFYDLYYLYQDAECKDYLSGKDFYHDFLSLYNANRKPKERNCKHRKASPLFIDFPAIWAQLSSVYIKELRPLVYSLTIPSCDEIELTMVELLNYLDGFKPEII